MVLVIFTEYFFSEYNIIQNDIFERIINLCKMVTNDYMNCFIFINLLHYIDNNIITNEIKEDLLTYTSQIYDYKIEFNWEVKNCYSPNDKLFDIKGNKSWYSNTVFVIFRNKIILKKRKSTYSNEIGENHLNNYFFGFGFNEKGDELNEEEEKFFDLINNYFCIFICYDYQRRIDYYRNLILNEKEYYIQFDEIIKQKVLNLKNLFKKYSSKYSSIEKDKKKIFLLISNTTNINSNLSDIPENALIVYCDPMASAVFNLEKDDNIKNIIMVHNNSLENEQIKLKYHSIQVNYFHIFDKIKNSFENEIMEKNFFRITNKYIPIKEQFYVEHIIINKLRYNRFINKIFFNIFNIKG